MNIIKNNFIEERWEAFESAVMSPNAGPEQRVSMKRAFFSGFSSCYKTLIVDMAEVQIGRGEEFITDLSDECNGFAAAVARGEA